MNKKCPTKYTSALFSTKQMAYNSSDFTSKLRQLRQKAKANSIRKVSTVRHGNN